MGSASLDGSTKGSHHGETVIFAAGFYIFLHVSFGVLPGRDMSLS